VDHEQKPIVFEHEHGEGPAVFGRTAAVFLVLAMLTGMAVIIGFSELGPAKVWLNLGVAFVQAIILSLFFMELRYADKLTWLIAVAAVFWTFLMFLFILTDYLTRHFYAY